LEPNQIKPKSPKETEKELNQELDKLLKQEKYEEAACLRDYMLARGFKRKYKF
jgi:protein-arginine kinase activator protein McsA